MSLALDFHVKEIILGMKSDENVPDANFTCISIKQILEGCEFCCINTGRTMSLRTLMTGRPQGLDARI